MQRRVSWVGLRIVSESSHLSSPTHHFLDVNTDTFSMLCLSGEKRTAGKFILFLVKAKGYFLSMTSMTPAWAHRLYAINNRVTYLSSEFLPVRCWIRALLVGLAQVVKADVIYVCGLFYNHLYLTWRRTMFSGDLHVSVLHIWVCLRKSSKLNHAQFSDQNLLFFSIVYENLSLNRTKLLPIRTLCALTWWF